MFCGLFCQHKGIPHKTLSNSIAEKYWHSKADFGKVEFRQVFLSSWDCTAKIAVKPNGK
jgi:hypothetical protein